MALQLIRRVVLSRTPLCQSSRTRHFPHRSTFDLGLHLQKVLKSHYVLFSIKGSIFQSFPLTIWAVHVKGTSLLTLVPLAAALRVGPEPSWLRADKSLVVIAVLVVGVAHRPLAAVHGEAVIADQRGLVKTFLVAGRGI